MRHVLKRAPPPDSLHVDLLKRRRLAWCLSLTALGGMAGHGRLSAAEPGRLPLVVIYPDIEEPFRSVFLNIVRGVEDRLRVPVPVWPVPSDISPEQLQGRLRQHDAKALIALGRSGLKAGAELSSEFSVVAGGVVSVPETDTQGLLVQSLAPDPSLLFARLRTFVPGARRVHVVHDPRQNAWLMRLARDAARHQGLELVVQEAPDLRTAVRVYREMLSRINARADVIWLPQDTATVDDASVVPLVLKESWVQRFAVVSSNVAHVRRGALLALYPDNLDVGRELAGLALQSLSASAPAKGIQPLRQLRTAVNTRTASHLGLELDPVQQRIHLVLPEQ